MGKGSRGDQARRIAQKYVTPESEVKRMMNSGMSNAAIIKALQERWRKEEVNIERLGVILKQYAPESVYGDKEKSKELIGRILNAKRAGEGDELSGVMLEKLRKAKKTEGALLIAVKVPVFLALIVFCFLFMNPYWGMAAIGLFIAWGIASVLHPRSFFPRRLRTFRHIVKRMYDEEVAECKKKKEENGEADVYMLVIEENCTLGRSYSF